jgi:hypothetical protein
VASARGNNGGHPPAHSDQRVSLWVRCFAQNRQYFLYSTRPVCFFLFFVVE